MAAVTPNDAFYAGSQWHLQDPVVSGYAGAANLPLAWGETQGSSNIVVAVIDTGVLNHSDLSSRFVGGSASASGYDFINDVTTANDGNGRDSDQLIPVTGIPLLGSIPIAGSATALGIRHMSQEPLVLPVITLPGSLA